MGKSIIENISRLYSRLERKEQSLRIKKGILFKKVNQKYCIYLRCAVNDKTKTYPMSLRVQKQACLEFAKKKGLNISKIYTDCGYSGNNLKRPALNKMLKELKQGNLNGIVVQQPDRLARDSYLYTKIITLFKNSRVKVLFAR